MVQPDLFTLPYRLLFIALPSGVGRTSGGPHASQRHTTRLEPLCRQCVASAAQRCALNHDCTRPKTRRRLPPAPVVTCQPYPICPARPRAHSGSDRRRVDARVALGGPRCGALRNPQGLRRATRAHAQARRVLDAADGAVEEAAHAKGELAQRVRAPPARRSRKGVSCARATR